MAENDRKASLDGLAHRGLIGLIDDKENGKIGVGILDDPRGMDPVDYLEDLV